MLIHPLANGCTMAARLLAATCHRLLQLPIYLPPMPYSSNKDKRGLLINLVENAVIPCFDTPETLHMPEFPGSRWARVLSQRTNLSGNTIQIVPRNVLQVTFRGGLEFDPVNHGSVTQRDL